MGLVSQLIKIHSVCALLGLGLIGQTVKLKPVLGAKGLIFVICSVFWLLMVITPFIWTLFRLKLARTRGGLLTFTGAAGLFWGLFPISGLYGLLLCVLSRRWAAVGALFLYLLVLAAGMGRGIFEQAAAARWDVADGSQANTVSCKRTEEAQLSAANRKAIILIHGLNSNARETWGAYLSPHREVEYAKRGKLFHYLYEYAGYTPNADLFVFDYQSGKPIEESARELAATVTAMKQGGKIDRELVLIGHSLGGLVGRCYVERLNNPDEIHVSKLITVATPHGGTELAKMSFAVVPLFDLPAVQPLLSAFRHGRRPAPVGMPAMAQLDPEGSFLNKLNRDARPRSTEYVFIGGVIEEGHETIELRENLRQVDESQGDGLISLGSALGVVSVWPNIFYAEEKILPARRYLVRGPRYYSGHAELLSNWDVFRLIQNELADH